MEEKQIETEVLQDKISKAQAVYSNLIDFNSWEWSAYKVEAREKDIVIEALKFYLDAKRAEEEELHDSTDLCE